MTISFHEIHNGLKMFDGEQTQILTMDLELRFESTKTNVECIDEWAQKKRTDYETYANLVILFQSCFCSHSAAKPNYQLRIVSDFVLVPDDNTEYHKTSWAVLSFIPTSSNDKKKPAKKAGNSDEKKIFAFRIGFITVAYENNLF